MSLELEELLTTLELGSAGVVTTLAAWHLGLARLELLMALFFSTAILGQVTTAMLARVRGEL
ncbi:MAG TPA: hypothetical protein VN598_16310 [Usitatibacter sp.]|nr:hypothetical protein [Usitatibacter sp.]